MPDNKNTNGGNGSGPWGSEPDNDDDNRSPWSRGNSSGNGGSNGAPPPDLGEQFEKMRERLKLGSSGGQNRSGGTGGGVNLGRFGALVAVVVAGFAWLATGLVVVDAGEQATVFRFGKWQTNFGSGLRWRWPTPIGSHVLVPVEDQLQIRIGDNKSESLMLTEDENIADIQFSVFWKVNTEQPQDFILNVKEPEAAVRMVAESVMREVVGKSQLQNVITTERDRVQQEVKLQTQTLLDEYRAGIDVLDVQIARSDPPQPVIEAFNDVNKAEQDAETRINNARQVANQILPEARAYRDRVIAESRGAADRFNKIYAEYRLAPQVTRERMYLETIERVLARADKTVLDSESGAVPYLPLDRVERRQ